MFNPATSQRTQPDSLCWGRREGRLCLTKKCSTQMKEKKQPGKLSSFSARFSPRKTVHAPVSALHVEHRDAAMPGKVADGTWEGEHLLPGRGQAEQFLQVLPTQPQSPNPPMPSQSSFSTVTFFGGGGRGGFGTLQSGVTAQSVVFIKFSQLFPANHLQSVTPRPEKFPSPIPCLHFLPSLVLNSTI